MHHFFFILTWQPEKWMFGILYFLSGQLYFRIFGCELLSFRECNCPLIQLRMHFVGIQLGVNRKACANCGHLLQADSVYCRKCGHKREQAETEIILRGVANISSYTTGATV